MGKAKTAPQVQEVENVTEEGSDIEVKEVMLDNGFPLLIGEVAGIIPWAKKNGYGIFYLLGGTPEEKVWVENQHGVKQEQKLPSEPKLFRVTCNPMGYAIRETNTEDKFSFEQYHTTAWFDMPVIPLTMLTKLDTFFRTVNDRFGTEAIVVLTYDPRVGGSDGWGFIVPEQTNTAAHCKYDMMSVIDDKDDEVMIAGTAHSHPEMSAFASHTDEKDQANQDGLHITFGWPKGSGHTEHHIEFQASGESYEFRPHQVFESIGPPEAIEGIEDWLKKVKQEQAAPKPPTSLYPGKKVGSFSREPGKCYDLNGNVINVPEGAPEYDPSAPKFGLLIRLLDDHESSCPYCGNYWRLDAVERRRCWECFAFLIKQDETLEEVIAIRQERTDAPVKEMQPHTATKSLMFWNRWLDNQDVKTQCDTLFEVEDTTSPKA